MDKWNKLKQYIERELKEPMNNDDIPKSILEDILFKMEQLEHDK